MFADVEWVPAVWLCMKGRSYTTRANAECGLAAVVGELPH